VFETKHKGGGHEIREDLTKQQYEKFSKERPTWVRSNVPSCLL